MGAVRAVWNSSQLAVIFIDAHADLRPSYQGVSISHASVAYSLLQLKGVNRASLAYVPLTGRDGFAQGKGPSLFLLEPLAATLRHLKDPLPLYNP